MPTPDVTQSPCRAEPACRSTARDDQVPAGEGNFVLSDAPNASSGVISAAVCVPGSPALSGMSRMSGVLRLLSTAILGFALSEVAGRFSAQTARQRDADFELLLELLTEAIRSRLRA
jgi:hypothetical protein